MQGHCACQTQVGGVTPGACPLSISGDSRGDREEYLGGLDE